MERRSNPTRTPHSLISFRNCNIHEVLLVGMGLAQRQRHDTSTDTETHKNRHRDSHRRQSAPLRSMQAGRPGLRELGSMELMGRVTASSRRRILCARCSFGKGAADVGSDADRDRDASESRRVTRRSPIARRRVEHTRTRCTRSSSRRW